MDPRPATTADVDVATRIISAAFATDPVWEVALRRADGRTDHHPPYWRLFVEGALRFGTVFLADEASAVSIWLPPGADELSPDGSAALEDLLERSLDPADVAAIHALYARFEASRARLGPHYYLSLLATDQAARGRGVGQALLAADLARWDAEGIPAYLESTNPGNDHRYARAGFRSIGGFEAVRDRAWVNAMWRDVPAYG